MPSSCSPASYMSNLWMRRPCRQMKDGQAFFRARLGPGFGSWIRGADSMQVLVQGINGLGLRVQWRPLFKG